MNTWLHEHLVAAGHMTEAGTTRRARLKRCPCRDEVLVGLDDIVGAFEVKADPTPLSGVGEVLALLEGRVTFALNCEGAGFVLNPRDQRAIAAKPAGRGVREDVVRQHRCSTPPPLGVARSTFPEVRPRPAASAAPEF